MSLPFLPVAAASEVPPTAALAVHDYRPVTPTRAGRNYFRTRTMGAIAPSRKVRHPHRPVVKAPARKVRAPRVRKAPAYSAPASASGSALAAYALRFLGAPYVYGAAGPRAFDCSGLVLYVAAHFGIRLPHKAAAFYGVGRAVPQSQIRAGDILVLNGGGHAAIALGNGLMLHAPHTGDHVRIAKISGFSAARRIV